MFKQVVLVCSKDYHCDQILMRLKKPQKIAEGFQLMFDTMILDFNSWSSFVSSAIAYAQIQMQ